MTTSKLAVIPTISATSETLRALSDALSGLADRVVVVANSESAVRACEAAGVNYIDPQRNAGFGGAVHAACEAENVSDDGWIIIVNDDLDLTDADSRDVKAASSLLDASGAPIVYLLDDTTRRIPTVLDVFLNFSLAARILARLGRHEASLDGAQVPSGHYRSFAFVGISKRAWLSLEGFDTAFTFTYEDADFARRSEFLGRAEVRPIAGVRHLHSVSSSAHVSHVLPVSAWSAYVYLSRTRVPRTIRRVVLTSALLIRLLLIPNAKGHAVGNSGPGLPAP